MPLYSTVIGPRKYEVVGSPTINNNILSGCDADNYLKLNNGIEVGTNNKIEVFTRLITPDSIPNECNIISPYYANGMGGLVIKNKKFAAIFYYNNGSSNTYWAVQSSITTQPSTEYYVKVYYNFSTMTGIVSVSIDGGKTYTVDSGTLTNYRKNTGNNTWRFGNGQMGSFRGSIDLSKTYITVNGAPWFGKCPVRVKVNSGLAKYTKVGNPTIEDGIITAVSDLDGASNYISIPTIPANYDKIEFVVKYNFQQPDYNANTYLYHGNASTNTGWFQFDINVGGMLECYISNNNNESYTRPYVSGNAFNYNYAKVTFEGNQAYCSLSNDGVTWIDGNPLTINKASNYTLSLGKRMRVANNTIDLNESYIKINGSYFWRGSDYYQNLDSYKVHQDNFSKYYTIIDGKLTWANPSIYLETDGNAYIKLPYKINSRTTFDIKAYCPSNNSNSWFFGAGVSYMQSSMILYEYSDNSTYFYYKAPYIDGQEDTSTGVRQWVRHNSGNPLIYKSYIKGDKYFLDVVENGTIYSKTTTGWNIPSDLGHNINYTGLFATFNTNTSVLSPHKSGIRIYKAKLWNNGINNFNLVPVPKGLLIGNFVVPSNGMFDIVTQTFYGNAGTGEFEIGGIPDDYIIEGGKMIWCNPNISLENNSNWSAYINTGIIPTNNMRLLVTAQLTDTTHTYDGNLLGSRKTAGTSEFCLWHNTNPGQGGFVYNSIWNTDTSSFGRDDIAGNKNEFKYDGSDFTINGVTARTRIGDITNFTSTYPIYVYALNINNTSVDNRRFRGKIYEVVFWSGSTILQYLVPVPKGILIGDKIAPSNCMFDLVTQTFFENKGTGEFTIGGLSGDYIFVGNDVVWCNSDIYLRAKGTNNGGPQYIDTGLKLSNTSRVMVDFQFNVNSSWLFAADNNDDGYPRFGFIYSSGKHFAPVWYGANKAYKVGTSRFDKNTIDFNKTNVTLNKTEYVYSAFTDRTFTTTQTCYLFANHMRDGSVSQTAQYDAQIYSCSMYNSDKLLRYFIPVTTNMQISDTTIPAPGMWDMVTKKFFPNKGTGSFTYGKDS